MQGSPLDAKADMTVPGAVALVSFMARPRLAMPAADSGNSSFALPGHAKMRWDPVSCVNGFRADETGMGL